MSAFHGVDDVYAMPAARFFALAWRLSAYRGVMRERVIAAQETGGASSRATSITASSRQVNPGTRATIQADPAFAGIFSFS
jgi:hypothetical protein